MHIGDGWVDKFLNIILISMYIFINDIHTYFKLILTNVFQLLNLYKLYLN